LPAQATSLINNNNNNSHAGANSFDDGNIAEELRNLISNAGKRNFINANKQTSSIKER
jgi:hypothetical protein